MRRRAVHLLFGAAATACAVFAACEGVRLREALRVNAAIAAAEMTRSSSIPEAQFARAAALAKRGDFEGALKEYKALSHGRREDIATAALYNAGNLQLRHALKEGREAAVLALPLIELAKQSYRGVLRRDPQSWDARYNLERALWLAPEPDEVLTESVQRTGENRVMSTLQNTRADLP
jgi:mxaK protein